MSDRLFRRVPGGPWYAWYYTRGGERIRFCTDQLDKAAARVTLRDRERDPATPARRLPPGRARTVEDALRYLVEESQAKDWPDSTLRMFAQKAGHLLRVLGAVPLAQLVAADVKRYIDQRLGERVARERTTSRETVRKELSTLRAALREAGELGWLVPGTEKLLIPRFIAKYVPIERRLSVAEFHALLGQLADPRYRIAAADVAARRRFWIAAAVYLGGRLSEIEERLVWEDVDIEGGILRLRGTKTAGSDRHIPIPTPLAEILAAVPLERRHGLVAGAWPNVRRDLAQACKRAGIPRVSPNDLRRTYASWLVNEGVPLKAIAELLGHKSTRMVDRTYGHVERATLAAAVAHLPPISMPPAPLPPIGPSANARAAARAAAWDKRGTTSMARMAPMARVIPIRGAAADPPPSTNHPQPLNLVVPKDGVEPPTRGFSVPVSPRARYRLTSVSPKYGGA